MPKKRRAFKPSRTPDYDRKADRPDFVSAFDADGERVVPVDDDAVTDEPANAEEFYREQVPPHHG